MKYTKSKKRKRFKSEDSDSDSEDESTPDLVDREGNHIYFYADVNTKTILKLNKLLLQASKEIFSYSALNYVDTPNIILHINSNGGNLLDGLSAVDTIRLSKIPITTIVEGGAASAATLISVAGKKRLMTKNSHLLIHQLSSQFWGKMNEFEDEMKNLNRLETVSKNIYKEYTSIPESEIDQILKHDLWWGPEKCLEYNIIDEII